jgi:alanyl-tRNA synthetase
MGDEDVDLYRALRSSLQESGQLAEAGVRYEPYGPLQTEGSLLALVVGGQPVDRASPGDRVEVVLPATSFYIEAGGQVSDSGEIHSPPLNGSGWSIRVDEVRRPAAGIIIHRGQVERGSPAVGNPAVAQVDAARRMDIMRNHTATHLLHAALHHVLGDHARQAGSLVAPDRLRFDFTHPQALDNGELEQIETFVNEKILDNHPLDIQWKPLQQALADGAIALFGEKYEEDVRNIRIGNFSNELCGGTHIPETNDIGLFMLMSESSAAAGIRRIEAITGRAAFKAVQQRRRLLREASQVLGTSPSMIIEKTQGLLETLAASQKELAALKTRLSSIQFTNLLGNAQEVSGIRLLTVKLDNAEADSLRKMADTFRQRNPSKSVAVIATVSEDKPVLVAAVTEDLVGRGLKAGDLAGYVARQLGGGGGGKPTLAMAGGKEPGKLDEALSSVAAWVRENLNG